MIVHGHRALRDPAFCGDDLAVAARRRIGISFRRWPFLAQQVQETHEDRAVWGFGKHAGWGRQ